MGPNARYTAAAVALGACLLAAGCGSGSTRTTSTTASTSTTSVSDTTASQTTTPATTSTALLDTITAAMDSGNVAALQPLMAPSVDYVIAATETSGTIPAATAVTEIAAYLHEARPPWNFAISPAVLDTYMAGSYQSYLVDDTYFGVSNDDMFMSLRVNGDGLIDQVFVAASTELLT